MTDLQKQCVKSVNEYLERADGNFQAAEKIYFEERGCWPRTHASTGMKIYLAAMEDTFNEMRPR